MALFKLPETLQAALQHHQAGRLPQAEALYREILGHDPVCVDAMHYLGLIAHQAGHSAGAVEWISRAVALAPNDPAIHYNLGVSLVAQRRTDEAVACFRQSLTLNPGFAAAHNNLGSIFEGRGQLDDAFVCFQAALSLNPQFAEAHYNVANLLKRRGRNDDAMAAYERAVALNPNLADAYNNLGVIYKDRGRFDDALGAYRRAAELRPGFVDAHNNLGNLLKEQGQLEVAVTCYRQALALQPERADIHSNLIFALHYHPDCGPAAIDAELRLWNERHVRPLAPFIPPMLNERSPDRRLRVGYVSPDFCQHAVGFNLVPLFENHAHDHFEIICYSDVPRADALTTRFRGWSDQWRDIAGQSHAQVADLIRQDRIDVLVDLALHTANNRLPVFARQPAPVQLSFAGYPGRTGLETMSAHLTDPHLTPPAAGSTAGPDAPFPLPNTFWCYAPLATDPVVGPLPALNQGRVTFGCLNNFGKVNSAVLALWSRVLSAVPDSHLVLLSAEGRHRDRVLAEFAKHGVAAARVEFTGLQSRQDYLSTYHRIDLGLDTLPYNGHTTSLDSYWMGVPVVTLVGKTSVGRAGWSQLSNLGLTELAARTPDEFVATATRVVRDLPTLARLRASLRARMQQSPLMHATGFARGIEAAYRNLWQRWCDLPARNRVFVP